MKFMINYYIKFAGQKKYSTFALYSRRNISYWY